MDYSNINEKKKIFVLVGFVRFFYIPYLLLVAVLLKSKWAGYLMFDILIYYYLPNLQLIAAPRRLE